MSKDKSLTTKEANDKFKRFEIKTIYQYGFKGHSEFYKHQLDLLGKKEVEEWQGHD